ncbi:MAG: NUDIX domain-containing protein [Patescibacteria group bacterium]|jgi:ADP-ribose pyrophosphatase YjhB (NUDIX family)
MDQRGPRVAAVIIKDNQLLLIHRIRNGQEYFVFPGGAVETGEILEEAIKREIHEEFGLGIELDRLLFQIKNFGRDEFYFLVTKFSGIPQIGGEEKERMNKDNQYSPFWIQSSELSNLSNLYPEQAKQKVEKLIEK